jgi:hypothetical protein
MKSTRWAITFTIILGYAPLSLADTASTLNTQASQMDSVAATQGQTKVIGKISSDYSYFLQKVDSQAVVSGLRNGEYTYTTPSSTPTGTPTQTTVALPTGKMGHGNVYISLALAKQQLSHYGITQPTDQQLYTALMGGQVVPGDSTTTTTGILQMRADGMGWGQIAHQMGYKLGPVTSSMKSANHSLSATASTRGSKVVSAGGKSTGSTGSGIVSGSGKSQTGNGHGIHGKSSSGSGIVTGSGKPVGGSGHAYGHGKGIVTGSGQSSGAASGVVSAGGQGNSGQARGHNK